MDRHIFSKILEAKGIEVLDFGKPVKRLIFIRPFYFQAHHCAPEYMSIGIFLFDIEDISKTWALKSYEDIIKEMGLLKEAVDLLEDKI